MVTFQTKLRKALFPAILLSGILLLSDCQKALTERSVEKKIAKAQRATEKAKAQSADAVEARKAYYMQNRQAQINEVQGRVDKIEERISTLNNISETSPNTGAVQNVNYAMTDFEREKAELTDKIEQMKSVPIPNWEASIREINRAIERIENELDRIDKSLETEQPFK